MSHLALTADTLLATQQRIAPSIHRTPVMTNQGFNSELGAELFFKCENFQRIGAFKMRGAANAVALLAEQGECKQVATHSSGNHGQALARAARDNHMNCYVVMPRTAAKVKMDAVQAYGAEIIECDPGQENREAALAEVVKRTGAHVVPPFNDERIIAGQATCAMELFEQVDDLDIIIAPVGGGGLLAGTALAAKHFAPACRVWAGEPANADDTARSLAAGSIQHVGQPNTIADGLLTTVGDIPFAIIKDHVERVITVSEREIVAAMHDVWQRMKIIIEPSCAVPFAALRKEPQAIAGKRVGVILTGGNVDFAKLPF
jgi:threonine dehydratase